jgi:hypothetical protein
VDDKFPDMPPFLRRQWQLFRGRYRNGTLLHAAGQREDEEEA